MSIKLNNYIMNINKIMRLANRFKKYAQHKYDDEIPPTLPGDDDDDYHYDDDDEIAPNTIKDPDIAPDTIRNHEPPQGVVYNEIKIPETYNELETPESEIKDTPIDNVTVTIDKNKLHYMLRYLKRNINNDYKLLERKFGKNIPEHKLQHIETINTIIDYLSNL